MSRSLIFVFLVILFRTSPLLSQSQDYVFQKLREAGISESSGEVPVFYPAQAKERALALQKSLATAHAWYGQQLHVHERIALILLSPEIGEIISDRNRTPHATSFGIVMMPEPMPGSRRTVPGADRDHLPGGSLSGENILFHEDGHILSGALQIRSANPFVNELVANIFQMAYIHQQRQDLTWLLEDRRSNSNTPPSPTSPAPRYTSLADLDYLYNEVGQQNYFWFQGQLERIADFLVGDQSTPEIIEKLQKAFPAGRRKMQTIEEIDAALETIRPGFLKTAGPLAGPSTINRITPSRCADTNKSGGNSAVVIIKNDKDAPLEIADPQGRKITISANSWRLLLIPVGSAVKLPSGSCFTAREEPSLAVIENQ
jgi:hypothetical protein